jgi:hypothetical protein
LSLDSLKASVYRWNAFDVEAADRQKVWWGCPSPYPNGFKTYASQNGFNSGLPRFSRVREETKSPKEMKNRHEAQSSPQIMKGEQKPFMGQFRNKHARVVSGNAIRIV